MKAARWALYAFSLCMVGASVGWFIAFFVSLGVGL